MTSNVPEGRADSAQTREWLDQAAGDRAALDRLLARYRPELQAFVECRLDPRLGGRLDASDVVQEALVEVVRRMDDFLHRRPMPFHLWVKKTAYERLSNLQRNHRRARRAVGREAVLPERSSLLLAGPLVQGVSPSEQVIAQEQAQRISRAVAELSEADREILLMRHAERLPYEDVACLLDVTPAAARKRYGRALIRLQEVLTEHGLLE